MTFHVTGLGWFDAVCPLYVQDWFHAEGVLPFAQALLGDEHPRCRLKGLLAISCQIRGHAPSLVTFCQELQGVPQVTLLVRTPIEVLRHLVWFCCLLDVV